MAIEGYTVSLLREGCCSRSPEGFMHRKCNTILIKGPAGSFIVNPGSVWSGTHLLDCLKLAGIQEPHREINGVICTDGRAEHVGCLSMFSSAEVMIVGYDIQKRGDIFLEHDFGDGIAPYEFDENFYVVGTPGQRGPQVTLVVNGRITPNTSDEDHLDSSVYRIAITGSLFADKTDASSVSFLDQVEKSHGDCINDVEYTINCWRRSRDYVLGRADWIVPAYGPPFKVKPEYLRTPCVELA